MVDAGELTLADFAPLIGQRFTLRGGGLELPLTLAEAEALPENPLAPDRQAFSLVFSGPPEPTLAQGVHRLEHADIGAAELFVVPLQPLAGGSRYQILFS